MPKLLRKWLKYKVCIKVSKETTTLLIAGSPLAVFSYEYDTCPFSLNKSKEDEK